MKKIFSKITFPKASGGDCYEWKAVETAFQIFAKGLYAIKIQASAKNAYQNRSKDDDDLRVALDGFDFGKYEHHEEMISWKGFGTCASWDGNSLNGGIKTIYFFVELEQGEHKLQFFADETPTLKSIEIFEIKNNVFELENLKPSEKIKSERKGIPWMSFVFLGSHTKTFTLGVGTKSAKIKRSTDGDNLKVIVNGKILQNSIAPKSYKYKNFYFSGDIKEFDLFTITHEDFFKPMAFENAVELWYDEEPEILNLKIEYFNNEEFLERIKELVDLKEYVLDRANLAIKIFRMWGKPYSAQFLKHSLNQNPSSLIFVSSDSLVRKIKRDPIYGKILRKLEEKILEGNLDGEIWPDDFKNDREMGGGINFNSNDLRTAIHGIHKIGYKAKRKRNNEFELELVFFDIYDFEKQKIPFFFSEVKEYIKGLYATVFDMGEGLDIIHDFEIEIRIKETLYVNH